MAFGGWYTADFTKRNAGSWIHVYFARLEFNEVYKALFNAQTKLLAEATNSVFLLQTQKKENQHKIDRLRDYERQIDEHIKNQKLWYVSMFQGGTIWVLSTLQGRRFQKVQ